MNTFDGTDLKGSPAIALRRDLWAGLMFVAFGIWGIAASQGLEMGVLSEMGPAFVPRTVSGLLILLGVGISASGFSKDAAIVELPWKLRPILMVSFASLLFALLLNRAGIVIAITTTVFVGSLAGERLRFLSFVALSATLVLASVGLFVWALGMPIPVWPNISGS